MRRKRHKNKAALSKIWLVIRKQSTYKTALSFCLALVLALQTVTFAAAASLPEEPGSPVPEPSVTETVYGVPEGALLMPLATPADKTEVLAAANPTFNLTVSQGDSVIPAGGEINGRDNFTIALADIAVPTQGDYTTAPPETVIQQGDFAVLDKATYFPDVNLTPAGPMNINQGSLKIATVQFFADSIRITFDGAEVYDGSRREVKIGFSATAKAANQAPGGGGDTSIFYQDYRFQNSNLVPEYTIVASSLSNGNYDSGINNVSFQEGAITWRAVVTATDMDDKTIPMPLDGLTFSDALENVGVYVPGSFTVDGYEREPAYTGGTLSYQFPNASTAENVKNTATITFKTWIPKETYYAERNDFSNSYGWYRIDNTAKLVNNDAVVEATSNTHRVAIRPNWIAVSGKPSKSGSDTLITWTVAVNQRINNNSVLSRTGLQNVKITDDLPDWTEFVSATYKNGDNGTETPITRNAAGEYDIGTAIGGNLNGPLYLTVVTRVTDSNKSTFDYKARANWDLDVMDGGQPIQNNDATNGDAPDAVVDKAQVKIGAHSFTKSVATNNATAYSLMNVAGARWIINLTLQYDLDNPTIYDLLVHGDSLDVLDRVDANPKVTPETLAAIKSRIDDKQLWQKYRQNSLSTNRQELTAEAIPLTVGGKPVADLIKVTGYKGDVLGSVSFESVTTNPDNLFRQDNGGNWSNRGLLFDGDDYVSDQEATVKNPVRMLNKEMLYASAADENGNPLGNIAADWNRNYGNWSASTWTRPFLVNHPNWYVDDPLTGVGTPRADKYLLAGYDRKDRTITFRLAVNMPGFKTEEMAKDEGTRIASDIKLVDTLPEGWEFVEYAPGEAYRLYIGATGYNAGSGASAGGYGRYAQAITSGPTEGIIHLDDPRHVVSFTKNANGNVGTFTFSKLESPYVILVKARPTNAKLATYSIGINDAGKNEAVFSMKWGDKSYSATETHRVLVPVKSLSKTAKKPVSGVQEWTVNYTPPFEMKQGVYLLDTLSKGLQLRKDANGNLSLEPSDIAVYPGQLKPDGTLERVGQPLNLADPDSEVKVTAGIDPATEGSTLRFDFTDPNKLYQIVYQTESQGMSPGVAGNSIQLMGDGDLPPIVAHSNITLDANDVAGSANENGLLYLLKVGPDGTTPLEKVRFKLYYPDGTPARDLNDREIEEKTTGSDGKTSFIIQVPGDYLLKQTYIDPDTYLPTTTVYRVRVIDAPGKPVLVDGQKVDSNNPLRVPTPAQGKLTVSNKVEGNGKDPDKVFEYTVIFEGEGKDGEYVFKKSVDAINVSKITNGYKILLKDGESVVFPALLADMVYTVTQTDYTPDGYTTDPGTREQYGAIEYKGDHKANFVNERYVNNLTVSNTVMGNGGDKTKEFEYTVVFEETGKDGSYSYEKSDGSKGTIKSSGAFNLKHGETLIIESLPEGLKYTVTQENYKDDGYVTNPEERYRTGVMEGNDEIAPFTNTRVIKGGLIISNEVRGKDDDKKKLFEYTISFTGEGEDESYDYEKSDGTTGTIASGGIFELTDGQTFVVQGLPTYLEYSVTQVDYTKDGYVTDPVGFVHTGSIPEKNEAKAYFVNTRPYLEGVLRDNNTGEVIPNVKIVVTNKTTGTQQEIWTNEKGEYSVPAEADTDYTITYTKTYKVGGKDVSVPFTQKANVNSSVTDETVPARITAVGIVLFKQLDGTRELFDSSFTSNMYIYLKDKDGKYIEEDGKYKAFPIGSNGTFSIEMEELSEQKYTMEVRYEAKDGQELLFKVTQLDVKANGELNISEELVDPYGTVYDETTGDAVTGKKIEGAKVTLYYANTQRNIDNGRLPGTKVTLPPVPNFPPHNNLSPEQDSDENGFYAYMVFPEADYYLVVTKPGYRTYTSDTISVEWDIVRYDVPMRPISSGGSSGGDPGDGNNGTGNGNPPEGNDNGNPPGGEDNGSDNGNPPGGGDNGTDNGNPPDGSDNGTDNGNPPGGDDNGTDNGNPPDGNNGTDPGIDARPPEDDELDDVPKTGDSGPSSIFYMALALIALIGIRIAMPFRKKKYN